MSGGGDDLQKFMGITGGDENQARHMLDAAGGDVNAAVRLFFEGQGSPASGGATPSASIPTPVVRKEEKKKDDKPEELFVGGGQNVIYKDDTQPQDLLDAARALGAVPPEEDAKRQEQRFVGSGRRLGSGADVPPSAAGQKGKKEAQIKITMWRNGFSVDDGPLRDMSEPGDKSFIEDIKKGKIPKEVLEKVKQEDGTYPEVVFTLEDKQEATYEVAKKEFKAFTGEGRSLGSSSAPAAAASAVATTKPVVVDESLPTTTIQLTMPDGTRMQAKFNLQHTIGDIAGFVRHTQPNHPPFTMLTTFPRQELTEMSKSIQAAGLARAVIMVKLL